MHKKAQKLEINEEIEKENNKMLSRIENIEM